MAASDQTEITVIRIPLIWLDKGINDEDCNDIRKKLCNNFGRCHFVQNKEEYEKVVQRGISSAKYVLIISGQLGFALNTSFTEESKISTVYVYCRDVEGHKKWADNCSKVKISHIIIFCFSLNYLSI